MERLRYRVNPLMKMDHDEIKHFSRKYEEAARRHIGGAIRRNHNLLGGREPIEWIETGLEPMNEVEPFLAVLPKKEKLTNEV